MRKVAKFPNVCTVFQFSTETEAEKLVQIDSHVNKVN